MNGKRLILAALVGVLALALTLTGCGAPESKIQAQKINIYTSFFPLYDMAKQLGGEKVNVINLIPAGVDAHDWTPKSREISDISKAQMFVYNGAGFEGWVEEFLQGLDKQSGPLVVEASTGIELIKVDQGKEAEATKDEHVHDHGHDHGDKQTDNPTKGEEQSHAGHNHGDYDPHTWLSPLQAKQMANNIYQGLIKVDATNKSFYEQNYQAYRAKLDELDQRFKTKLAATKRKQLVVQHEAYGYLCRDYGLTQMPIMGINPDAEPTARDMKKISDFVKKHNVKYIMFEEMVSSQVAMTLADDLDIETLVFSPIEGLTKEQEQAGETYISMMDKNLQSLVKALQ